MTEQRINSSHVRSKLIENWDNDANDEVISRQQFAPVVKVVTTILSIIFCLILVPSLFFGSRYFAESVFSFKPATAVSTGYGAYEHRYTRLLDVHYSYKLQGQTFTDSKSVPDTEINRQCYSQGNRIAIFYNPEKRSESVLNWEERIYFFLIPLICFIALAIAGYTKYRANKAKSSSDNGLS